MALRMCLPILTSVELAVIVDKAEKSVESEGSCMIDNGCCVVGKVPQSDRAGGYGVLIPS